jgi:single-strand DNA-binding protein
MNLNKAQLIGRLTRDPELKALPSGSKVCSFSMATNRVWKNEAGEKQEAVEFHNVVAFGKQAELIAQYVGKGDLFFIEGRMLGKTKIQGRICIGLKSLSRICSSLHDQVVKKEHRRKTLLMKHSLMVNQDQHRLKEIIQTKKSLLHQRRDRSIQVIKEQSNIRKKTSIRKTFLSKFYVDNQWNFMFDRRRSSQLLSQLHNKRIQARFSSRIGSKYSPDRDIDRTA